MTQGATRLAVDSGGEIDILSGGKLNFESGGYYTAPVQSLTAAQSATAVTNFGLTNLSGTTTGPTYTLAAPVPGLVKYVSLSATSSGATHRARLQSNTTGVSLDTTGGNLITFATSAIRGVTLVAASTSSWRITGVYTGASVATPRTT